MPHPPAANKQRLVAAVLSPEDYAAAQAYCHAHKIGPAEMIRRALSRLLEREMADTRPGRPKQ